ncbi:MAG: WD40/YVTN/BNR-like repeat-containing protein [Gammaproteobacteria bacterium]
MLRIPFCVVSRLLAAGMLMAVLAGVPVFGATSLIPLYSQLHWRQVGPFRGGWSTMAAGIPTEPNVFYFGGADGGVWKTPDAGLTWQPLFQHEASISVGALAIAPSNPEIIYVGTGQVAARYDVVAGDGVYRSDDGGKIWTHVGLENTHRIGRIWVDPRNPDTVLVAALGSYFSPNQQRGVFRSTDGGRHWQQVLFVNSRTGAVDISADDAHPDVIFAATWQARMYPWLSYYKPQAGPGSGIWKSTDEGKTWVRLAGHGLPAGPLGRIGVAVAPGTDDRRVYAIIDSREPAANGLYRSDDGGADWKRVGGKGLGNSYFGRVTVDPRNPDVVYVMNRSVARSTDGGRTFTWFKGAPGGDDYHFMWINPDNSRYMILASDQGTTVSVDGGRTWSSWYNQPTGQFYHVATDNRFPYRIYSGQQDSGTVETRSRSDFGEITTRDWHPVGGDERSYVIPDPGDPHIVYVGGLGGHVSRFDSRTGLVQNISAWPISSYAQRPTTVKYRYTWFYPLVAEPHTAHTLYLGSQVLFKTSDAGMHWKVISPDLSGTDPKQAENCDGDDISIEEAKACGYGVIFSIAPSPLKKNEIWIGTDDGLIQLTRDGGRHWQNVTPQGLPLWGRVNCVDASVEDPATAYAAVDTHRKGDRGVYIYRTHDYGRTWTKIGDGIPANQYVYVVRQDPRDPRLLYAGTDTGVYVSFNDGAMWQPLQLNLPSVRVRDMTVHGNDLVIATQGRALWVLDDVTPLRQASASVLEKTAYLFQPENVLRVRNDHNKDTPLPPEIPAGRNPPAGAIIDYWLGRNTRGPVMLAIYDAKGALVREYASDAVTPTLNTQRYFASGWLSPAKPLAATPGAHRFVWDLRYPRPRAIHYHYSIAAIYGEGTPVIPRGPMVLPGNYTVKLTVDGHSYSEPLSVKLDPRVKAVPGTLEKQLDLAMQIGKAMDATALGYQSLGRLHQELRVLEHQLTGKAARQGLLSAITGLDKKVVQLRSQAGPHQNLATINGELTSLATQVNDGDRAPPASYYQAFRLYAHYAGVTLAEWQRLQAKELPALNGRLMRQGLTPLKL